MAKTKDTYAAFAIHPSANGTGEPGVFGMALPGVWTAGAAHLAAEFELDDEQVRAAIGDGVPLVELSLTASDEEDLAKQLAKIGPKEIAKASEAHEAETGEDTVVMAAPASEMTTAATAVEPGPKEN